MSPKNIDYNLNLGLLYYNNNRKKEAKKYIIRGYQLAPKNKKAKKLFELLK